MTHFFKSLSLVTLSLALLVLAGCGAKPQGSPYTSTTQYNYFPSTTTTTFPPLITALSCSISASSTAVVPGNPVTFTVTASGGTLPSEYQFGNLSVDFGVALNLSPVSTAVTNFRGTASYTYQASGQYRVEASVSNKGANASCNLQLNVQSLAVNLTGNLFANVGSSISLVPVAYGFDPSKTVLYRPTVVDGGTTNPSYIRVSGGAGGITVQALDQSIHNNVRLTVRAYTDLNNFVDTTVQLAFLPQLNCRYSMTGSQVVNGNVVFRVEAYDQDTGMATGENLIFSYVQPESRTTVVSGASTNQVTLKYNQKGDYISAFRVRSPLRNQYCNWINTTSVAVSAEYLLVPLTIN